VFYSLTRKSYVHSNVVAQEHKHFVRSSVVLTTPIDQNHILEQKVTYPKDSDFSSKVIPLTPNPDKIIIAQSGFKYFRFTAFVYKNNLDFVNILLDKDKTQNQALFNFDIKEYNRYLRYQRNVGYFMNLTTKKKQIFTSNLKLKTLRIRNDIITCQKSI
jgi:hypothetical protein